MPPRPQFSGHETFALRAGWPKKAVDAAAENPRIFADDAAMARLGVGKNMVRSIRYWALALGVVEEAGYGAVRPSAFGRLLFDDGSEGEAAGGGLDPFLEDAGTAWLLHWRLCRETGPATLWHFAFGRWHGVDIGKRRLDPLAEDLARWLASMGAAALMPAPATLARDAECLKNCYLPSRALRGDLEDRLASPLAELGLVGYFDGDPVLRRGVTHGLPPWVFAYAVLDFWEMHHPGRKTLAFGDVLHAPGSPGRVFGLGEDAAFALVDALEGEREHPFTFRDTAGIRQFYRTQPAMNADDALRRHYAAALVAA
jgi:hypothetical protein